jgi:geranylgeranylglycerol-phosphate geranylgeranyltransferase
LAKWFSFALAALSILVASFINLPSLLIVIGANILLYIYSYKLKSTVLLGNLCVAFISAMSAVAGGVAAGNARPTFWLFWIIFVAILGREVLKTMADYEGDLSESVRTISTVWGRRTARILFYILIVATLIMMLVPYLLEVYEPIYAYFILIGVFPVIIYIVYRVSRCRTGRQLEKMSQLMKYDFLFWFLAVVFGSSV